MKKIIPLLLAALLLTACTTAPQGNPDLQITRGTEADTTTDVVTTTTGETTQEDTEVFFFMAGDLKVIPGTAFDKTKVTYESVYEVPSCALEGTDNVYNCGSYEITAFNEGKGEVTYSVFFTAPDAKTPEGLCLGDDLAKAATLYGQYEDNGGVWTFTRGNTQLLVMGENDVITSIELRFVP